MQGILLQSHKYAKHLNVKVLLFMICSSSRRSAMPAVFRQIFLSPILVSIIAKMLAMTSFGVKYNNLVLYYVTIAAKITITIFKIDSRTLTEDFKSDLFFIASGGKFSYF